MARIIWLTGNPAPVNAGEERVLAHLAKTLPDSVALIPNLTIPFPHPERPDEYDIIAITPDAVFAVEVKDLAANIEITEQHMFVNGSPRRNPYLGTRIKAQKLKSRLGGKLPWFNEGGWVEHVVVLARQPASLSVCDAMKTRVVLMDEATTLISPGTKLLNSRFHGQLSGKEAEVISCITDGASERKSPTVFGDFEATSSMFKTETFEAWRARHVLTGVDVVLEVYLLKPNMPQQQVQQWKTHCLQIEDIARQIGSSADLDGPRHSFQLDNGTLVVVWPDREPNTLTHFLNQMGQSGSGFNSTRASKLLEGFSSALAHLHGRGWVLGPIKDHNLAVRPNGRGAIVLGEPIPVRNSDTEADLRWLSSVIDRVNEHLGDERLKQLAKGLRHDKDDSRVSAVMAMAALAGANFNPNIREHDLLARFTKQQVISTHQFGQTLLALDTQLKREVIVKHESGRPELSWATREYRTLSLPIVANNPHVASSTGGDSLDDTSFVSIEVINAPTLASMIDAGILQDPEKALVVSAQLLETLKSVHPDVKSIMEILASVKGTMNEATQIKIGSLRENGIAHNHLDPSNIFVHPTRGVVLTDLVRAARFGEIIPTRSVTYWPKNLPITVSDPLADLFAVGSLLIRMLTTTSQGQVTSASSTTDLGKNLIDVALKAINDDPNQRFMSATEFLDALLSNAVAGNIPTVTEDVLSLQKKIEQFLNEKKFDEALSICPNDWIVTRERIQEKQKLLNMRGREIWKSGEISLRHIGQTPIPPGSSSKNTPHNGGVADVYHSADSDGGIIEILVCTAETADGTERWTATGNGFGYPDRLTHAVRSLRISIDDRNNVHQMELMQAQLKKEPKHLNQATKKMVDKAQLSKPIANGDADQVLRSFGASGFASKSELWGETGGRKNYLAVTFPDSAIHIPAVAHFISRILPLYAGITES